MSYSPTNADYLTVANVMTNNGEKNVKVVLQISTNTFYTLDDDNNFEQITADLTPIFDTLEVGGTTILNGIVSANEDIQMFSNVDGDISKRITSVDSGAFIDLNFTPSTANTAKISNGNGLEIFMDSENDGLILSAPNSAKILLDGRGVELRPSNSEGFYYLKVTLSTFANQAAAEIGGLSAGLMYKTATGELRVVV